MKLALLLLFVPAVIVAGFFGMCVAMARYEP